MAISERAQRLLTLEEGIDIEFKRNANNIKGEDMAAFANSEKGGVILFGVDEITNEKGRQETKIVGCPVGDKPKLSILNTAQQCVPPLDVQIFVENENHKPFYRLEIPSGKNKPYSSSGGTYKIRQDGNKVAIHPQQLLNIFLQQESGKFINNFKEATKELKDDFDLLKQDVSSTFKNLKEIERTLTGGDGYAYFDKSVNAGPGKNFTLLLRKKGDYHLRNVILKIYDRGRFLHLSGWGKKNTKNSLTDRQIVSIADSSNYILKIGDLRLAANELQPIKIPFDYHSEDIKLSIVIIADNGAVRQELRIIKFNSEKRTAYQVSDSEGKILEKFYDEGFPLKEDGSIAWD